MSDILYDYLNKYKGDGIYLTIDGIRYIDAASGTFNLPLGYTNRRIAEKLKEQIDRCAHLGSLHTVAMSKIILEKLKKFLPHNLNRIWLRDITGSGAVECAIRIAQKYTQHSGVISLFMSHHGQSMATAEISGNSFRLKNFNISINGSLKIPTPASVISNSEENNQVYNYKNIEDIYEYGSNENISCLIVEPILGNGGNIVLPEGFYSDLREFCTRKGIILIADEVQTGFGRTGSFFASTGYAKLLEPDIIVFAKGAGGIGIPTAGVLMRSELDVLEPFEHSSTSGANPLALVAMNETINIIEDEGILENVLNGEIYLRAGLLSLQDKFSAISNVRGVGYMYGFDTPSPEYAEKVINIAERKGLIIRGARYGKSQALKIRPPLICTQEHLREIIDKLDLTFSEIAFLNKKEVFE